jgi:Domain of unknown function (DUF4357)
VRIFLADGTPEGLRIVEKSNWNGRCIVLPRPVLTGAKTRDDFGKPGVYLLIGTSETENLSRVYVGEGDPVRDRFIKHDAEKEFWTQAVFFTGNLNKAHIQYLESRLIDLAHKAKRCILDNGNRPKLPSLSEADEADTSGFLHEVRLCLSVLGFDYFEQPTTVSKSAVEMFSLAAKGLKATGYESANGFVVKAGSDAAEKDESSLAATHRKMREKLVQLGILEKAGDRFKFTQDYEFTSPSAASTVVNAVSSNGRDVWKDTRGYSLNERAIEAAKNLSK